MTALPKQCENRRTAACEGVAEEILKLDNLTRMITDSMNEMAAGAVQINNAVQEVNAITQKNKTNIENLSNEVSKFKV